MSWVTHEFECLSCGHEFEEFYKRGDEVTCPECGSVELKTLISAAHIGTFSLMDTDGRRQHLLERSAKHTQSLIDKEPEKFKEIGIERRTKKIQTGYGD